MAELQKTLSQPSFQQSSTATAPDRTAGDAITLLGGAIAGEVVDRRVRVIGQAFDEANTSIAKQEAEFNSKNEAILNSLVEERDRSKVQTYMNEYDKLHAGEVQGTLSPMEGSVRREQLYRKYASAYPVLKDSFLEVTKQYEKGTKVGASDDPVAKARAALIEKSVATGVPVPVLVDIEQVKMQNQIALERGVQAFGQLQVVWDTSKVSKLSDLQLQMMEEINSTGGLDAAMWKHKLVSEREALKRDLNIWTVEATTGQGITVGREDINSLQTDIDTAFTALISAVDSTDLQAILDRSIKIQQDKGIQVYIDNFGSIGALMPMMGVHGFEFFNNTVPELFDSMKRHGNFQLIRQLAKSGDKDAMMFTSMWDSGAFESGKYMEALQESFLQGPVVSQNQHEQAMTDSVAFGTIAFATNKAYPDEVKKNLSIKGAAETIFRPTMPTENLAKVSKDPNFRIQMRTNPEVQAAYNSFVAKSAPELRDRMTQLRAAGWKFEFNPIPSIRSPNSVPTYFTGKNTPTTLGQFGSAVMTPSHKAIERINYTYDLYRLTVGDAEAKKLALSFMTGESPEPVEITEVPDDSTVENGDELLRALDDGGVE